MKKIKSETEWPLAFWNKIQTQKGSNERLFNTDKHYAHFWWNLFQAPTRHLNNIYKAFICCLSVVLGLDEGDFHKNVHTVCLC